MILGDLCAEFVAFFEVAMFVIQHLAVTGLGMPRLNFRRSISDRPSMKQVMFESSTPEMTISRRTRHVFCFCAKIHMELSN